MLLHVENLDVEYEKSAGFKKILDNISLQIGRYSRVGIIGESGSGKTQFVHSILGLLNGSPGVTSGKIVFRGKELLNTDSGDEKTWRESYVQNSTSVRGNDISIIFQDAKASLIPYQTINEQIIETWKFLDLKGGEKEAIEKASTTLRALNLNDIDRVLKSYPDQMSGGECQRVYIMLALLGDPLLLIADEPISSLDDANARTLLNHLNDLCTNRGISLLLISHEIEDIIRFTDYVYVMYNGSIMEAFVISDSDVMVSTSKSNHPYTKTLLKVANGKFGFMQNEQSISSCVEQNKDTLKNEFKGCPYYYYCGLRKELSGDSQNKCLDEKPALHEVSKNNKVACWHVD